MKKRSRRFELSVYQRYVSRSCVDMSHPSGSCLKVRSTETDDTCLIFTRKPNQHSMNIGKLRREYDNHALRKADLRTDPFDQFDTWFKQACDADILEPNAMSLATVSESAHPTLRTVLLKYYDHGGFVFFTNLESTKARQITQNPNVALLFPWLALDRQLIITGQATKISSTEAFNYFITRPRGSQLGAWVSRQSRVISSRSLLEIKLNEMRRKFFNGKVPLPSFWGGYRVKPVQFEFWQGQPNRLHDRFRYNQQEGKNWKIERLAP